MAEVKWIKITTDVFDDEKILLIKVCRVRTASLRFGSNFLFLPENRITTVCL